MMQEKSGTKAKKRIASLGNVATLLAVATLAGQVLGFLRTKFISSNFGPEEAGAFFAAFVIPDFFFYVLAAGALGVAFMPFLSDRLQKGDRKGMWELSTSLLNLLSLIMFAVGVLIFILAEPLLSVVAPGLKPHQADDAVMIMRLLALNPLFFSLSGVLVAAQQTMGRFFFYAIAPMFYNVSILASALIFSTADGRTGGPGELGVVGLGIGAAFGALLQLIVIMCGLLGTRFTWRPKIMWRSSEFRSVLRNLPPRSLDQGMDQLLAIVETRFASFLGTAFITYYNIAYTLHMAPILLLGTAISTAAFPQLNKRLSQGRPDLFRKDFLRILRLMVWLSVPVVIVCYFGRGYIARLIFADNAPDIALIFGFLTVAIFFRVMYTIISRWFYAQKDTKTPLLVSVFAIGLNIALVAVLARPTAYHIAGLAIAQSVTAMVEVFVLSSIMLWRDRKLFDRLFLSAMFRILSVSGFALIAGYVAVHALPLLATDVGFTVLGTKFAIIVVSIMSVYLVVSALFGLEEAKAVFTRAKRLILKPIKVEY
jgi:putative peptidoglycan lipid II flippase